MRIALTVDPEIPVPPTQYGGIERIVDFLAKGLVAKGHDVHLYAHPDSKTPATLHAHPYKTSRGTIETLANTLNLSKVLLKQIDVVHSFSRLAYLSPLLLAGKPCLMSYQREPTLSQVQQALKLAKPNKLQFTGCSAYIANQISPFATSWAIPNGVEIEKYEYKSEVAADAPLMFLGRIQAIKGTHIAIQVALATGRKLIIAGNIPIEKEHQDYFEKEIKPFLDHPLIQYVGPVNDAEKNEWLGQCAAFLMPVQWNEPFGIVMAEALACGTPVIAFPFGACPEVVRHGINGYLVNNVEEMTLVVGSLSNISRLQCRLIAEKEYSAEVIVNKYEEVYKQMM